VYIGAIPTPAATESRQEFLATANQSVFNTTGGTVGYCDCYLNGVKMANSDFSFDGADVTLTTGAAAGDVLAVVMRQADNALVALPITDSAGNNVLSETNNVVSIDSGVVFPGKIIKNIYIDSTATDTTITNSTSNKIVYSVSIPNPQTSYSYLIIGGIGGYIDTGNDAQLKGSLIKDNGLGTQAYIQDTISAIYLYNVSYNDMGFFLNLNYYYEPATSTAFTIDAAVRSTGFQYRAPHVFNNPFIVLELGGN